MELAKIFQFLCKTIKLIVLFALLPIKIQAKSKFTKKHSIVASEDDFLKKIKKPVGSFLFTGLNLNVLY